MYREAHGVPVMLSFDFRVGHTSTTTVTLQLILAGGNKIMIYFFFLNFGQVNI